MRRTRILFLSTAGRGALGGAEHNLLDLLRRIDLDRLDVRVLWSLGGNAIARRDDGRAIPVEETGYDRRHRVRTALQLVWRLRGLRREVDLMYANDVRAAALAAGARLLGGAPAVWHVHDVGDAPRTLRWLSRLAPFRRCVAVSRAVAESLTRQGFSSTETRVVHNGVDVDRFGSGGRGAEIRRELGCGPRTVLIGIVGRILEWKGQDVFVRAAAEVVRRTDRARFAVVGDVPPDEPYRSRALPFKERLTALVRELGLGPWLTLTGERTDIPEIMAALDVLVLASAAEPFGRVIIEAMASGKPVVATRAGGVSEIVEDGITGLLVPPGDFLRLAEALLALIDDATARERLGQTGQEVARRRFSHGRFVGEIEATIADAIAGAHGRVVR